MSLGLESSVIRVRVRVRVRDSVVLCCLRVRVRDMCLLSLVSNQHNYVHNYTKTTLNINLLH